MTVGHISLFGTKKVREDDLPDTPKKPLEAIKEILARYGAPETKIKARKTHFKITRHVRERYLQRFAKRTKYEHLDQCSIRFCRKCSRLRVELHHEMSRSNDELHNDILDRLERSTEERSFINNTEFMSFMWEKYGYEQRFTFLRDRDAVFVIKATPDGRLRAVVTVLPIEKTVIRHMIGRNKFGRKDKSYGQRKSNINPEAN